MRIFIALSIVVFCTLPDISYAATEYATFESFYKKDFSVGWVFAGLAAIIGGVVIFYTGGTASPIVASIGSWVGAQMGLTGIAATNAGLALLGGGSIASGGFGIIGGTVLITAALSFGTDVVIDYTTGNAVSAYKYSNLTEQSKKMPTLPLPLQESGPDSYEFAMTILERTDKESFLFSEKNQKVIHAAITVIEANLYTPDSDEKAKNDSLLSLLYFVSNNYKKAKDYSDLAITSSRLTKTRRTLPAFIYATSSLYEEDFDFESITQNYFRYSILAEPENPLIPLLVSIYLDRISLRFNDNFLDESSLNSIFNIMESPLIENHRVLNYTALLSRYFILLKLEQQKIISLSGSANETIKNNTKTLDTVIKSLESYDTLIKGANDVMTSFLRLDLEDEDADKSIEFYTLLVNYIQEKERLSMLKDDLKAYQDILPKG